MSSGVIDVHGVSRTIRIILQVRQVADRRGWFEMPNARRSRRQRGHRAGKGLTLRLRDQGRLSGRSSG